MWCSEGEKEGQLAAKKNNIQLQYPTPSGSFGTKQQASRPVAHVWTLPSHTHSTNTNTLWATQQQPLPCGTGTMVSRTQPKRNRTNYQRLADQCFPVHIQSHTHRQIFTQTLAALTIIYCQWHSEADPADQSEKLQLAQWKGAPSIG